MRLLGVLLVVGCHFEGTATPDTAMEPDVPPQSHGMTLTWSASPVLPGAVNDKVTVLDVVFQLEHLQLVSDAGADDRTTRSRYQLEWKAGAAPPPEMFPDAPIAVYQRVSLDLRPDVLPPFAYQIIGTVRDEGEVKPFRIADPALLEIPIDCSAALPAGGGVSIAVKLDLRDALNGVDFKSLQEINGTLVLSGGPQMLGFRNKLIRAFSSDD
jgi:hypothetical protein